MPLRMINLIVEATEDCFNAKQKLRLRDITSCMGEIFRAEVLTDLGTPALRHACLQLITKLRVESAILSEEKDEKAPVNRSLLRPEDPEALVVEEKKYKDSEEEYKDMM
jgi:hypothetical protein